MVADHESKTKKIMTRTLSGILMLVGFWVIINSGHVYTSLFLLFLNASIFREVLSLRRNEKKEE